ncbi:ABATE domain-containing protein [Streptomyces roseirectus]|uniref:ABATE domain-containing protein n=1 Tax=Streptomyces roseirectus TaxID=2768066 RepID=A0A7H0IHZ7_9ACTN|nr:ABATE domain-containing protein [Streptomyces roseirectus]QNP72413.1 ABATE domain-containing protein [Streptomyces roseirectus]
MALRVAMVPGPYELRFDAGRLCLDLLATSRPHERLDDAGSLAAWIGASGVVPVGALPVRVDAGWLVGFRELRGAVGRLVQGCLHAEGFSCERPLAQLNEAALPAPPAPRAVLSQEGLLTAELATPATCSALLSTIARDALDLLTDPSSRAALRECEGDNCGIVYLDTSRGRRRRWCSSEVCGNRERVARHRRRAALARA